MKLYAPQHYGQKNIHHLFIFLILFSSTSQFIFSQPNMDDRGHGPEIKSQLLISTVGFAPVPAFSFDSPMMTGSLSIKLKKLSYQPDCSIGLNGKPWMINHWLRYTVIENHKLEFHSGLNLSLFFKNEYRDSGKEIVYAHRNITFELAGTRTISKQVSLIFTYMHIKAFDPGTLSGDFIDLSCPVAWPGLFKYVGVNLKPQVFYFDFEGNISGLYTSNTITLIRRFAEDIKSIAVYFQGVMPVMTDFSGNTFKWNMGIVFTF